MTTIKIVAEERAEPAQVKESELPVGKYYRVGQDDESEIYRRVEVAERQDEFFFTCASDDHSVISRGDGSFNVYPCHPDGTPIDDEPAVAVEKVRADSIGIGRMFSRKKGNEDFIYLVVAMVSDYVHSLLFADGCNAACTALTPSADLVTPVTITEIHYRKGAE